MDNNKSLRALIVEDSGDDVLLLVNALNEGGFAVDFDVADTPSLLRNQLREREWDVVLCDHSLPQLDAHHALDIVRENAEHTPFIIVSGSIGDELAARAMQKGAADFVSKSNLMRLAPAVERELKEAALRLDLRRTYEALERSSLYDGPTDLPNGEHLQRYLVEMVEEGRDFMLVLLELKRLRPLLRTAGVELGNRILAKLGKRVAGLFDHAFSARISDDQFALVLEGGRSDAEQVARRARQGMERSLRIGDHEMVLGCEVGISLYPEVADPESLSANAAIALMWAKEQTLDGYAIFDRQMDLAGQERIALERALYRAVRNQEFFLHYQPQIDLIRGKIVGVEALLRWNHPERGMVSPAKFIPLLEETQLIVPVGEWVMQTACEANCRWQSAGLAPVRTAVNLSAIQFRQASLVETVDRVLERCHMKPDCLELEITENVAMYNEADTIATLGALKIRGLELAIDDFGTGYSSLSYLKQFPVGRLKIDRRFVADITHDPDDGAIVKAILAMASSLKLEVIAEGVETATQAEFLRANGCREAQGFYYSRPVPEGELVKLLAAT